MAIIQRFNHNLVPYYRTNEPVRLSQFDKDLTVLHFAIWSYQDRVDLTGMSASISGRKPDDTLFFYQCEIVSDPETKEGEHDYKVIQVNVKDQMSVVDGRGLAEITLSDGTSNIAHTANFSILIEKSPTDGYAVSETEITVFQDLLNQAQEIAGSLSGIDSRAETAARNAANSATQASNAATSAEQSRDVVIASVATANAAAESATASATNASASATSASQSATSASASATSAETSASNAATSESNVASAVTIANDAAQFASISASNAQFSATNASDSATSASNSADTATVSASQASGYASQAAQSAEQSQQDYTNIYNGLSDEIAQRTAEDTVINARIDNIMNLPEGSTTGDAQLADIAIGYDGTVYDTPGNAVRAQAMRPDSIAETFSPEVNYEEGQYVWYNKTLYRFTRAHNAGAWTGTDASACTMGDEMSRVNSELVISDTEVFGGAGEGFPLEFENGTYLHTAVNQELQKYTGGGYDLTRKVVKSTTFTPPCYVNIKAKLGYSFTVFLSENGIITSSTGPITEYTMIPDQQYGVTLRTTDGTDDISETPVNSIVDIMYVSRIDSAIGDILSVSDRTNVLHNLIDYGYADKTVIAQPASSVPALHIGVSRKNTEVILDLSESQTNAMRVKVSGDIVRAASNTAVDGWTSGLQTISGNKYRAMMLFESGTRTGDDKPIIVFYKTGEHSAIGNGQFDADKYIREWTSDGSSINIVIYIAPGITLTNAKYQIIFQDVTDEINIDDVDHTANSAYNKVISLDEETNALHDLVAYSNGDYEAVANPDSAYIYQHLGVSRIGSQIKLNLASEHTQTFCIKASGSILRATSNNDINAWTSGLTLKNNHKYRVWAEYASGTIGGTGTNHPRIVVFNVGEHVSIGDVVTQGYSSYRDFVYTGTQVNVGIYVYANTTLTDATYQIYIQDITESFADMQIYNEVNRLGLHSMPETQGHLNVIKRARQYTEIRWTPAVDFPRCMYIDGKYWTGVFKGGVEYKGIPYGNPSQTMEDRYDKALYVCFYVPFDTFVTAVSCKDSIIAKENVASTSSHSSIAYAGICSSLVSYAIGISLHSTTRLPDVSGMTLIGKINDDGTLLDESNFRLCDILNVVGLHTAIITDIIKDASGNIMFIEVSEETPRGEQIVEAEGEQEGGVAIRRGYSLADFYTRWGNYSLLRYSNIASVTYTPSRYINVGGELEMLRYDRLPCLPYEGDKFTYKTGYIPNSAVKILIETHEFNKLRVFKDGTEISGSPFSVGENDEYINVTEIGAGEYSAYLCNMSGETDTKFTTSCYWTIT